MSFPKHQHPYRRQKIRKHHQRQRNAHPRSVTASAAIQRGTRSANVPQEWRQRWVVVENAPAVPAGRSTPYRFPSAHPVQHQATMQMFIQPASGYSHCRVDAKKMRMGAGNRQQTAQMRTHNGQRQKEEESRKMSHACRTHIKHK